MSEIKRVFRQVSGDRSYKPWKTFKVGDFVEGTYLKTLPDKFGHVNYIIMVSSTNISDIKENCEFHMNYCGSIANRMKEIKPKDFVRIEYNGVKKLEKGTFKGKDFHDIKVLVAEDGAMYDEEGNREEISDISDDL